MKRDVIPAKAGIHVVVIRVGARLRGDDRLWHA